MLREAVTTLITERELLVDVGSLLAGRFLVPTVNPVSIGLLATSFSVVDLKMASANTESEIHSWLALPNSLTLLLGLHAQLVTSKVAIIYATMTL